MLISSFFISWIVSIIVRYTVVYGIKPLHKILIKILFFSILVENLVWLLYVNLFINSEDKYIYILVGFFWLITHSSYEYSLAWLRADSRVKEYSLAVLWRILGGLIFILLSIVLEISSGIIVFLAFSIAMAIGLLLFPTFALNEGDNLTKVHDSRLNQNELLRFGLPAAFINISMVGLSYFDRYIIQSILDSQAVGLYNAIYEIAEKTIFFINSMIILSSSIIGVRVFENGDQKKAAEFLSVVMRFYLIVIVPVFSLLVALSSDIIAALLPNSYHNDSRLLAVVSLGGVIVGIMQRYSLVLTFNRRTDIIMWCTLFALLINISACWALIPKFGLIGAGYATLVAYAFWLIFIRISVNKYNCPRFPWLSFFRVLISGFFIQLTLKIGFRISFLDSHLLNTLLLIVSSIFVYGLMLLLLGEFKKKELERIKATFKNILLRKIN